MEVICKRCLLKDMGDEEYYQSIKDYIDRLSEEMKTDKKTYEKRLILCQDCDCLVNGMCRLCGCFVEVRAAKAESHCPRDYNRW